MADGACTAQLGGWVGYGVEAWRHEWRAGRRWLVLELTPVLGQVRRCSGCHEAVTAIHDRTIRRIRDLPVFEEPVELEVERLRLACLRCGPRLERLDWFDAHARATRRLAESVARLCAVTSILQTTRWFWLDWKAVKTIDFQHLERGRGPIDLAG